MKKNRVEILFFVLLTAVLAACAAPPAPVEVTRLVPQDVPVTVEVTAEVTRVVTEEVAVETEVEVTRVVEMEVTVEVVATPTAEAAEATTAVLTETETITPTVTAATETTAGASNIYTVVDGDSWDLISFKTQTPVSEIKAANGMESPTRLHKGMELTIPGWDGVALTVYVPGTPTPAGSNAPITAVAAADANLFQNGSFEEDWYFFDGVSEWQLPDGWAMSADEGTNPDGSGGVYLRPEIRLLSRPDFPTGEANTFIFDGDKTIKAFKGGAPTSFAIFRDVALQPGTYRLTTSFFPDSVLGYDGGKKVYNTDPLSAETRMIVGNGGTVWEPTEPGQKNTVTYDFTVDTAKTVRLGTAFRNRFEQSNNGWFIDDWSLQKLD